MSHAVLDALRSRPVLVLSPHLDDAWLSTAGLLQNLQCEVWSVFAGEPDPVQHTPWDTTCGFSDSAETMAARRAEDLAAFEGAGAQVRHLSFLDGAYVDLETRRHDAATLQREISEWIMRNPNAVVALPVCAGVHVRPAAWQVVRERLRAPSVDAAPSHDSAQPSASDSSSGLSVRNRARGLVQRVMHADHRRRRARAQRRGMAANPDHVVVRDAALRATASHPDVDIVLWEDLPYLWHERGAKQINRIERVHRLAAERFEVPVDVADKFDRLQHYRSQLDVLDPDARRLSRPGHLPSTETYWLMRPAAPEGNTDD